VVSTNASADFPPGTGTFNSGISQFLDARASTRVTSVLLTPFDLSNNNGGGTASDGATSRGGQLAGTAGSNVLPHEPHHHGKTTSGTLCNGAKLTAPTARGCV
jgi:outer membrane exchange protein TraA